MSSIAFEESIFSSDVFAFQSKVKQKAQKQFALPKVKETKMKIFKKKVKESKML